MIIITINDYQHNQLLSAKSMIINTINDYHHNQSLSAHYPKTMTQMTAKYSVSLNALGSVNSPNEVNIGPEIRLKIEAKNPLVSKSKRENN